MGHAMHTRLDDEARDKLIKFAGLNNVSRSAAIAELISHGFDHVENCASTEKELAKFQQLFFESERKLTDATAEARICLRNERLAKEAQRQAETNKAQFEEILSLQVATCSSCNCNCRIYDVWMHRCPSCGNPTATLLDHYQPAKTPAEGVRIS